MTTTRKFPPSRPGDWRRYFEERLGQACEPEWASLEPCTLDRAVRRPLARSLAVFQLGESGGGSRLRRFVRRAVELDSAEELGSDYERAVELFIEEEHEHARILAELIAYLGGDLQRRHWLNRVFRAIRATLGLEFNLQVLLTAELIAEAYYGLLSQRAPDATVREVCGRIVRDEAGHIAFHRTFFRWRQRRRLPAATALWSMQFQVLYLVAEGLVWHEHRDCFQCLGVERRVFAERGRVVCRRFLEGVGGREPASTASATLPSP